MLPRGQLRLVTLGRLALLGPDGDVDPALASRRRQLAVLAMLAMSRRPVSRDRLVEMFWGGQPEERARHSLSNTLSHLRRVLGRDAVSAGAAEVELDCQDLLEVDALAFAGAVAERDDELAVELYGGPFLAGIHVEDSSSFDDWSSGERARLEKLFLSVCQRRCLALARNQEWTACADLAGRWLDAAPLSSDAALYRLNALKAPGTREALGEALAEFERLRVRLRRDYGAEPERSVVGVARELSTRIAATGDESSEPPRESSTRIAASGDESSEPPRESSMTQPPPIADSASPRTVRRSRRWAIAAGVAAVAALTTYAIVARSSGANAQPGDAPVVALVDIAYFGDAADVWVGEGLPQMIAGKLARAGGLEVIEPGRVRDTRLRLEAPFGAALDTEKAREIARRLSATWMVTGAVVDADTSLQLDLTIRDVRTGAPLRAIAIRAPNVLALADAAATRLLDLAGAQRGGVALAELETTNIEAYEHFIRFLQLRSQSRDEADASLDAAIALDSGFVSALLERITSARLRGEWETVAVLDAAFQRAAHRATDWDRLSMAAYEAFRAGAWPRAEAAARALVERFPRDPRAHQWLVHVYTMQGRWSDAERAGLTQLALDSLAVSGGRGPCVACVAYHDLATLRMAGDGDYVGAERLLRRLLELQPDLPGIWSTLARSVAGQGRWDDALAAERRAIVLSGLGVSPRPEYGRLLISARRYDAADSAWRSMAVSRNEQARSDALEIRYLLERERGRYRASIRVIDSTLARYPERTQLLLMRGEAMGRLGDFVGARQVLESHLHRVQPEARRFASPGTAQHTAEAARAFSWWHALAADAISPAGDTVVLRALADSIEQVGASSYYGRDRRLHLHVRGLIAMHQHRWDEAQRLFAESRWGEWGWSRTAVQQARAKLALGEPLEAAAILRRMYAAPLDGMGRYTPRSELDYWMAVAFRQAGMRDSAAVYTDHARRAWRDADPEVKVLLRALD